MSQFDKVLSFVYIFHVAYAEATFNYFLLIDIDAPCFLSMCLYVSRCLLLDCFSAPFLPIAY